MNKLKINNVILFNGEKEYGLSQILENDRMNQLMKTAISFGGFLTLIEKINKESGVLYLTSDSELKSVRTDLKDVSTELYDEYLKTRT